MVADHVQQGEHIPHFRTFQQGRLSHDQRGQPGLLERFRVLRHGSFGSEQHRHMRAIVFRAMVEVTRRGRMQGDRMFGEAHDRVDFLAECGESEHANRAFGGFFDVGECRHVDFAHQRAAEASGWQAQRFGEIVRRFEHHARIAPCHRQCERFSGGIHAEIVLQHAECARACASPCVDRLEGVADRVDRAAMRIVSVEQRAQQCGLRGGGVLVFVEKHMRVTFTVRCADGWESGDQLECRDGEIAEFRHIAGAFFGMIIKHEVEQQVALLGDGCELRTVVYAHAVSEFAVFLQFLFVIRIGILFQPFRRFWGFRLLSWHGFAVKRLINLSDERFIPVAHTLHRLVEAGAAAADHSSGNGVRQGEYVARYGVERFQIAVERHEIDHMLVEHGVDELHGSGLAQWLRVLVEADKQSVLTHNGLEESVVRGDFRFEERHIRRFQPTFTLVAAHGRGHARQQFRSRFARESQSEDFFGVHALFDQCDDSSGHCVGFARSGTGDHHHILIGGRLDNGGLLRTVGEFHGSAHAVLLSNTVFCSPAQAGQTAVFLQYFICSDVGLAVISFALLAAAA